MKKGIRKRKKKLYKIENILNSFGVGNEIYIWRTKSSPELKKALMNFGCVVKEVEI